MINDFTKKAIEQSNKEIKEILEIRELPLNRGYIIGFIFEGSELWLKRNVYDQIKIKDINEAINKEINAFKNLSKQDKENQIRYTVITAMFKYEKEIITAIDGNLINAKRLVDKEIKEMIQNKNDMEHFKSIYDFCIENIKISKITQKIKEEIHSLD